MKLKLPLIIVMMFFLCSCGGSRKTTLNPDKNNVAADLSETDISSEKTVEEPIIEVEEKLVAVNYVAPEPYNYFVIIGSFRNPNNAKNYQKQIEIDGFSSELLKNENGLYRVSVMASNDIVAARKEIKRIREKYPKYSDTWLLIQVK